MLKWNGVSVQAAGAAPIAVNRMWGTAPNNVYAATSFGTGVSHYDGTTWTEQATANTQQMFAISGAGGRVWAVGAGASILMR
jgi:hypothetical protein